MAQHAYCPSCGYPNEASRGACVMCYGMLHRPGGGNACPSCGADNAKSASFCGNCQAALVAGARPAQPPDLSALVGAAAVAGAGVAAGEAGYAGADDYMDFGIPTAGEEAEVAPPAAPGTFELGDDFAAPPPPPGGPVAAAPAPPPAPSFDQDAAPPPPPGALELDFDEVEALPPPPPGAAQPAKGKGEEDLGDWSLDYDET